jgi:hypothetical protein
LYLIFISFSPAFSLLFLCDSPPHSLIFALCCARRVHCYCLYYIT